MLQGVDYVGVFQLGVKFIGNSITTTLEISIIDDDLAEGVETFIGKLVVSSPSGNFSTEITIEIIDNEGKMN